MDGRGGDTSTGSAGQGTAAQDSSAGGGGRRQPGTATGDEGGTRSWRRRAEDRQTQAGPRGLAIREAAAVARGKGQMRSDAATRPRTCMMRRGEARRDGMR